jgi:hypothetical protein
VTDRQLLFVFSSSGAARLFVKRLVGDEKVHAPGLKHLAILIQDESVTVIDGGQEPRDQQIRTCARTSGAIPAVR